MKYQLYKATDNRDGKPMLWLHDKESHRVALFSLKWAPSRIKQYTKRPDTIMWRPESDMLVHAALPTADHIDAWG